LHTIRTNRYGIAYVRNLAVSPASASADDDISLHIAADDGRGARGEHTEEFDTTTAPFISIETGKTILHTGDPVAATLSIHPATDAPVVVVELVRDMETIHTEVVRLKNGRVQLHFPFRPEFKDEVTIAAYLRPHGESGEAVYAARTVIFPRKRELQLDVADLQPLYRPGAEVETLLTTRTPDGRAAESALGVVIFDRAVDERARTDRDFGSGRGFYGAYRATFDGGNFAGISRRDLDHLDFTQPVPEDLQLVAAINARNSYGYSLTTFDGTSYDTGFADRFKDLTARQFKAVTGVLPAATATDAAHPRDEATLRAQLARDGINLDTLLDPWREATKHASLLKTNTTC
jgi:hypothetical protein